jgi:hypothetical protein
MSDVSHVRLLLKDDMQHSSLLLIITVVVSLYIIYDSELKDLAIFVNHSD